MNDWTRQDLEERLLDYLYDELEPAERAAFERALPAHPELLAEVDAHRRTRQAFGRVAPVPLPAGLLDGVLREAEAEAARRAPAAPGFWARVSAGLKALVSQPAFALAVVAVLVGGVALYQSKRADLPGMGESAESQRLPVVLERGQGQPTMAEAAPAAPAAARVEGAKAEATALAEAEQDGLRGPAGGEVTALLDGEARHDAGKMAVDVPKSEAKAPAREPAREPVSPATKSLAAEPAAGDAGLLAKDSRRGAYGGNTTNNTGAPPGQVGQWGPEVAADAPTEAGYAEAYGNTERSKGAPMKPTDEVAEVEKEDLDDRMRTTPATPGPAPATTRDAEPAPAAAPARREEDKKSTEKSEVQVARESKSKTVSIDDEPSAPKPAPDLKPAQPTREKLWSTYQQQVAAGAWADAERTIAELAKVEGESERVKAARASLKSKADTSRKSGSEQLPPDPPKPANTP